LVLLRAVLILLRLQRLYRLALDEICGQITPVSILVAVYLHVGSCECLQHFRRLGCVLSCYDPVVTAPVRINLLLVLDVHSFVGRILAEHFVAAGAAQLVRVEATAVSRVFPPNQKIILLIVSLSSPTVSVLQMLVLLHLLHCTRLRIPLLKQVSMRLVEAYFFVGVLSRILLLLLLLLYDPGEYAFSFVGGRSFRRTLQSLGHNFWVIEHGRI
jgi:hypothetical protein